MRESSEASPVEVDGEWGIADNEGIESNVELLPPDEQRVVDIALGNVCLG